MVQEVVMPQMGESITEGTVIRWIKKPGDRVKRDEPLFEISTDKVDTEIPSPGDGVLSEIKVKEGETVPVNTVVCILSEAGSAAPAAAPKAPSAPPKQAAPPPTPPRVAAPATPRPPAAPAARTAAPAPPPARPIAPPARPAAPPPPAPAAEAEAEDEGPHRSSPLVRKIAQEHGVDVAQVKGSGTGGRVTKKDILDYISLGDGGQPPVAVEEAGAEAPAPAEEGWDESGVRIDPISIMRAKIGEHMVQSRHTSAHVTTFHEVDLTGVARMREAKKAAILKDTGVKLTFLPFVLKAAVSALRDHPVINASLVDKEIHYHRSVHLGIAVAIDDGLIVPVIRNAEEKSVLGLARAVQDLAERARTKRLTPQEVQGGTFTVTNFGSFGSIFATPIINQPQVAILGVGAAVKRPVVLPENDAIAVRTQMVLCLSFDHRLIDGATADRYLSQVRKILEQGPFDLS